VNLRLVRDHRELGREEGVALLARDPLLPHLIEVDELGVSGVELPCVEGLAAELALHGRLLVAVGHVPFCLAVLDFFVLLDRWCGENFHFDFLF